MEEDKEQDCPKGLGSEGIMGAEEDKRAAIYLMLDG